MKTYFNGPHEPDGPHRLFLDKIAEYRAISGAADHFYNIFLKIRDRQLGAWVEIRDEAERLEESYETRSEFAARQVSEFAFLTRNHLENVPEDRDQATLDLIEDMYGENPPKQIIMDAILGTFSPNDLDSDGVEKILTFIALGMESRPSDVGQIEAPRVFGEQR